MFAHRVRPSRGHHADLRLRRPDGRRRPARDVRRAALLRPVRRPRRPALGPARLGGAAARARPEHDAAVDRRPARAGRRRARGRPADGGRDPVAERAAGDRRRSRDRPPRPPARAHLGVTAGPADGRWLGSTS